MHRSKEELRNKKNFDYERKRKEKTRMDRGIRINEIKKGDFYKIVQSNGKHGTGRVIEATERILRLCEYSDSESSHAYKYSIRMDEIKSLEPMVSSIKNQPNKNNVIIVTMTTGTMGYGELVKETEHELILTNFVFFSDGAISYDITIKKDVIREVFKLVEPVKEVKKEVVVEEVEDTKDFKTDAEIGKTNTEKIIPSVLVPFYEGQEEPKVRREDNFSREGGRNRSHRQWDQFAVNEKLFGLKATFDESMYTTVPVLDKNSQEYKDCLREAEKIARRIDNAPSTGNVHIDEERGRMSNVSEDDKYSTTSSRGEAAKEVPGMEVPAKESPKEASSKEASSAKESSKEVPAKVSPKEVSSAKEVSKVSAKESSKEAAPKEVSKVSPKETTSSKAVPAKESPKESSKAAPAKESAKAVPAKNSAKPEGSSKSPTAKGPIQKSTVKGGSRSKTISKSGSKNDSPKRKDEPKTIQIYKPDGTTGDFSDRVFQGIKAQKKEGKEKEKEKEKVVKKVEKVEKETPAQAKEEKETPVQVKEEVKKERPAIKFNAQAKSFDPASAARHTFLVEKGSKKKIDTSEWMEKGNVKSIPWGNGKSFMHDKPSKPNNKPGKPGRNNSHRRQ